MKGVRFQGHQVVGDIVELAQRYSQHGADELVFYDITASPEERTVDRAWVSKVARAIDIPFCVAGGIQSVADAEKILGAGAEKISINTPALNNPGLIDQLAERFGSQCVVVGMDSMRRSLVVGEHQVDENIADCYQLWRNTGDSRRAEQTVFGTLAWVREVQERGAGEIVLNCMQSDGVRLGFDVRQLQAVRAICSVPLIASGGAGAIEHFQEVFEQAHVDGALAASVFHSGDISIPQLKKVLKERGLRVRV